MNQASLNALDDLRVATQALLDEQKLSASRVVTVNRNLRSVQLLAFDYYGDGNLAQDIIDVNKNINVPYFEGDIGILTT